MSLPDTRKKEQFFLPQNLLLMTVVKIKEITFIELVV
ncbi:hypothetical protein PANA5342_pPANA10212 (plasmid) [Pantoea ananatis LMG 5342]|nr:hypothetical protein PANA5342_pPANA10212 [Pantoea ananatis LMG 5342]